MTNFFLGCFLFGAIFTLVTSLLGSLAPDAELGSFGKLGKLGKVGKTGKLHLDVPHDLGHAGGFGEALSGFFTLSSVVAFLTWFGAAGYVLTRATSWPLWLVVPIASVAGVAGAGVIAAVLAKIRAGDRPMLAEHYELPGTLARVSIGIPENGVGEIVFSMAGTRRNEAARAEQGASVPDGAEVVITRYERGIAIVEPIRAHLTPEAQARQNQRSTQQDSSPLQE